MPPGVKGTVIDAQVFSRKGVEKDSRSDQIERAAEARMRKDMDDENKILRRAAMGRISKLLDGAVTSAKLIGDDKDLILWGFTAGIIARLFDFLGWTKPWDETRKQDLPDHMLAAVRDPAADSNFPSDSSDRGRR